MTLTKHLESGSGRLRGNDLRKKYSGRKQEEEIPLEQNTQFAETKSDHKNHFCTVFTDIVISSTKKGLRSNDSS